MKSENFLILEKFFETVKSVYIYIFSLFRIRKKGFFSMIYKYLMHFVSVCHNQNVNVRYLIIVTTCNKRILSQANF